MTRRILSSCLLIASLLLILVACDKHHGLVSSHRGTDSSQDSVIRSVIASNPEEALLLIDSLEDSKQLPESKTNYYRGQIHYKLGQELTAELYYKRAISDNRLFDEQPSLFYFVSDQLSIILTRKGDLNGALSYATTAHDICERDTTHEGMYWTAVLLHDIGYNQMLIGQNTSAEKSFRQAWNTLKQLVTENPSYDNLYTWARITHNIIDAYTTTAQYKEAEKWLALGDEAVDRMANSPDCSSSTAEEYIAALNTHKALVYLKIGRSADARRAYQRFLGTDYSKTGAGIIEHGDYLQQAGRWNDFANLVPTIDSIIQSWATPASLYYLKSYLTPYMKAYINSGRTKDALVMGERIANMTDSIYDYERQHNAAELAIMYDTQEKEKQIAEQQSMLKNQRYMTILIVILLILIAITAIAMIRLHNAQKLAEKNHELEQKNKALTQANARAEESSRMKSDFIKQISHEIRTPLNVLSGFTQVLTADNGELTHEERRDINDRITKNTSRITELVNKMLELSEMHSKSVIERPDMVKTTEIASRAVKGSDMPKATHITFHMEYDANADKRIRTDARAASRALELLLNNAAKFTKAGSAELRITLDEDSKMVAYTVTDTGIGIPPYEAERIFEEFFQLDNYAEGTGIGLSVARSIVRRLGGDIHLDTSYQGGARFIMTLPDET